MYTNNVLLALASMAAMISAAAVPEPKAGFKYPDNVSVTHYPNGLPEALKPITANETELAERGDTNLEKRADSGVYFCTDRNFSGTCVHIVAPNYVCVGLGPDLNDKVSSVGPDKPSYCLFYSNTNCNDNEGHFGTYAPGYSDLSSSGSPGRYWNDRISSYVCHPN